MSFRVQLTLIPAIILLASMVLNTRADDKVLLARAVIVADGGQPSFVQYGVEDLAGYLKELTGKDVPVRTALSGWTRVQIVVGTQSVRQILSPMPGDDKLGEEGYTLKAVAKGRQQYVLVAGATPRGTKAALGALMKTIQVEGKSPFVPFSLDVLSKPAFAKRGMHFNGWAFNYPYTFRCWREEDWYRYLDILAYQGVNLFYLWPFIEIMPVPLSPEDQAYLEECRRVVDYAQKKHGMEVWIMQCSNRVASDRCGVADPRHRPYWRASQEDLDPRKPEHFQAIMASREAMYRIINNVDGVCNIDSDPGASPAGCTLTDYLKVLQGFRDLLDRCNLHGKQAKLINWMWYGWGRDKDESAEHFQRRVVQSLKQNLPEPWGLVSGMGGYLPLCREEGVLAKTVFLPYNFVESEPSYPSTNVHLDSLRNLFSDVVRFPELAGVMGNVQTPLLQFPHVYLFTSLMWDPGYAKRPDKDVLLELASHLYPEQAALIADCFFGLNERDPVKLEALANRLDRVLRRDQLGRPGVFGRKLFPDERFVAQSLLPQLQLHAAGEKLRTLAPTASRAECQKLLADGLDAYLAWDIAHGWHTLWGWQPLGNVASPGYPTLAERVRTSLGTDADVNACFDEVARILSAKYDAATVRDPCIAPTRQAVIEAKPCVVTIRSLAQKAKATASVVPDPIQYPPNAANDGLLTTLYWPGVLITNNTEWLQLTWDEPQTFTNVVVQFLQNPSMPGRTIHLQKQAAADRWEDFATTVIPTNAAAPFAVATFKLPAPVKLDKIRVVNLLDLFDIDVQ